MQHVYDGSSYLRIADGNDVPEGYTIIPVAPDPSIIKPIPNGTNDNWVEGADQATLDQAFVDYCLDKKAYVDRESARRYFELTGDDDDDAKVREYKKIMKVRKTEIANTHWNANGKPGTEQPRRPEAQFDDGTNTNTDRWLMLAGEAAAKGINLADLVSTVIGQSKTAEDYMDQIESLRSPAKQDIQAFIDANPLVIDYAGVDAIITQFDTDLAAIS